MDFKKIREKLLVGTVAAIIGAIPSGGIWLLYRHSENQRIERNMEVEAEHLFHQRIKDRLFGRIRSDFYSGRYYPGTEHYEISEAYAKGHIVEQPTYHTREQLENLVKMGQEDRATWNAGKIPPHREKQD